MAAHSSRSSLSRQIALRIPNAELDAIEAAARRNGLTRAGEIKRRLAVVSELTDYEWDWLIAAVGGSGVGKGFEVSRLIRACVGIQIKPPALPDGVISIMIYADSEAAATGVAETLRMLDFVPVGEPHLLADGAAWRQEIRLFE